MILSVFSATFQQIEQTVLMNNMRLKCVKNTNSFQWVAELWHKNSQIKKNCLHHSKVRFPKKGFGVLEQRFFQIRLPRKGLLPDSVKHFLEAKNSFSNPHFSWFRQCFLHLPSRNHSSRMNFFKESHELF